MSAGVFVGFPFYVEDPLWKIHSWVYQRLMMRSACVVGGLEFNLCPEDDETQTPYWGVFVRGADDGNSKPISMLDIEKVRERVIDALEQAGIYIPCQYGPVIYISNFGGSDGTREGQKNKTKT